MHIIKMKKSLFTLLFFCAANVGLFAQNDKPTSCGTCPDGKHPHLIDLGLPSGTKWACCNVGAETPEDYGDYYAWGETEEKEVFSPKSYEFCTGKDTDGDGWYDEDVQYVESAEDFGEIISGTHDVAHVRWGGSWQMPTLDQMRELLDNCSSEWTMVNDVEGRCYTGLNGKSIFLPAAGLRNGSSRILVGNSGDYWSCTWGSSDAKYASDFTFDSGNGYSRTTYRYYGCSVRPVSK